MADAPDLGSGVNRRAGSTPVIRIIKGLSKFLGFQGLWTTLFLYLFLFFKVHLRFAIYIHIKTGGKGYGLSGNI